MSTFSKVLLSGSTNGRLVPVAETATPGTLVHTAGEGTTDFDEVWIYVTNTSATARLVTIEFGGVTDPGDLLAVTIPANATELVVPGLVLQNGLAIRAFGEVDDALNVGGYVNRITA
jgi:hypothetical protein